MRSATNLSASLSSRSLQMQFIHASQQHTEPYSQKETLLIMIFVTVPMFCDLHYHQLLLVLGGLFHVGTTGRWKVVTASIFQNGHSIYYNIVRVDELHIYIYIVFRLSEWCS
jgi:hypothetical protein